MSNTNKIAIIGIVIAIFGIIIPLLIDDKPEDSSINVNGSNSSNIIQDSNNITINPIESIKNQKEKEIQNEKEIIKTIVSDFYNSYLKMLNKDFAIIDYEAEKEDENKSEEMSHPAYVVTKVDLAKYLSERDEIDFSLALKIDEIFRRHSYKDEIIDFDFIIMAQAVPDTISFSEPIINNDTAEITMLWSVEKQPHLKVKLQKKGKWKIINIINIDPYENIMEGTI